VARFRRLVMLGALGALGAAIARRRRGAPDEDALPAPGPPEQRPAVQAGAPGGGAAVDEDGPPQAAGALETEGPLIGDPALAMAVAYPDDATLVARVESELYRDPEVPKGRMNLDAASGVVTLRGEVEPAWVDEVAARVAAVEGVVRVENLLHPPGTPAPHAG